MTDEDPKLRVNDVVEFVGPSDYEYDPEIGGRGNIILIYEDGEACIVAWELDGTESWGARSLAAKTRLIGQSKPEDQWARRTPPEADTES